MRIFVSSTFEDLVDHRGEVRAALEAEPDFEFGGMEEFGSSGLPALETCREAIDETQASVVLLGYRYGSLVPASNISYTEAEYEYAQMIAHPVFVYIRERFDEGVDSSGEDAEHQRLIQQFRATVESEVVIDRHEFTTPDDLVSIVMRDLQRWLAGGREPTFQEPQLTIRDVLAYAGKRLMRRDTEFLAPKVVLVDLNAVNLAQTPRPDSSGLAMKMAKIKFELQLDGIEAFNFTDLRVREGTGTSNLEQRLDQLREVNPLLVVFSRDVDDVDLLEQFRDAGVNRIVWFRDEDAQPPDDYPLLNRYRFSRESLRNCEVALITEASIDDYRGEIALRVRAGA